MTRQEALENVMVAIDTLRANKTRSGLTILGIVMGVTTVIAVASIIDGLNGEIKERVQRLGSNTSFYHSHSAHAEYRAPARKDPHPQVSPRR